MGELKVIEERSVLGKEFRIYGDFENPLFVTPDGRVFRKNKHNKYYKNGIDGDIYELPYFYWNDYKIVNHKGKTYKVHRLVAFCYLENPSDHLVVNHIDGDKLNNHFSNLEWCTQQHNTQHAYDIGLAHSSGNSMKGESNPMYGKTHTDETKFKISRNKKGQEAWNKSTVFEYEEKPTTLGNFKRVATRMGYLVSDFDKRLVEHGKNNKYTFKLKNGGIA